MLKLFYLLIPLSIFANPLSKIETFQADFTQSIINSSGKEIRYNGKMYAKQPYFIYWRYNSPIIKNVYFNKKEVVIIEPELEQAITSKLDKEIHILDLLKDARKISSNHYISQLNNIDYSILLKDDKLARITYTDEIENKVTIYFENALHNQKLDSHIFQYKIPSSFDIIKK